jgi:hypothetical protein
MSIEDPKPDARPLFRRLAAAVAVVCFVLAAVFRFAVGEADTRLVTLACLAVGVIMLGISMTGSWPWWGRRKP